MLDLYGKRHGKIIVRHEMNTMISERTVAQGHIIELNGNYLECVGFQGGAMVQPRFMNVTLEIQELLEREYEETINDFLAGTGRF